VVSNSPATIHSNLGIQAEKIILKKAKVQQLPAVCLYTPRLSYIDIFPIETGHSSIKSS